MTKRTLFLCCLLSFFFGEMALAAKTLPSLDCALSDEINHCDEIENDKIIFYKNTPKIYLYCDSINLEKGQTVRAVWIAENSKSLDYPNYELDESTLEVRHKPTSSQAATLKFSTIKPANDWPAGSYKINLYIDGKYLEAIHFSIK